MYHVVRFDLPSHFRDNAAAIGKYLHMIFFPSIRIFLDLAVSAASLINHLCQASVVDQVIIGAVRNNVHLFRYQVAAFKLNFDEIVYNETVVSQYHDFGLS